MTEYPVPPVVDPEIDAEWVEKYRAVSITQGHADGTATTRCWFIEAGEANRLAALLGTPQETVLIPTGTVNHLAQVCEGLPIVGGDFFE